MQAPPRESFDPVQEGSAGSAAGPPAGTEHLSSLKQSHLRELAALTGLGYVRLQSTTDVADLLQDPRCTRSLAVPVDARAPLEAIALALLVFAIGPIRRLPIGIARRLRTSRT
jgi:mxaL protein